MFKTNRTESYLCVNPSGFIGVLFLICVLIPGGNLAGKYGAIVALQPYMDQNAYKNGATFEAAVTLSMDAIVRQVGFTTPKLIVFPEYYGTWLVASGESESVFAAETADKAMLRLILHHPWRFISHFVRSLFSEYSTTLMGHVQRAVFRMQADHIFDIYFTTFFSAAREYNAWIVAGSTVLPRVLLDESGVPELTGDGLYNVSFTFGPDGTVRNVVNKVFPVDEELLFLDRGEVGDINVVDTELGKVGVLICADSWYPESYSRLAELQTDIVVVPSFMTPAGKWREPWAGYTRGLTIPADVDPEDRDTHPECRMWDKYAVGGRLHTSGASLGVNTFFQGRVWDITAGGQSVIVSPDSIRYKSTQEFGADLLVHYVDLED